MFALKNDTMGDIFLFFRGRKTYSYMYPLLWFGYTDLFLHFFIHKMCAIKNDTMGENIFFFLRGRKTYSYMYPFTLVWVH